METINPLRRSFKVSFQGTKVKETDGKSLLGSIGVSIPSASSSVTPGQAAQVKSRTLNKQGGEDLLTESHSLVGKTLCNYETDSHPKVVALQLAAIQLTDEVNTYKDKVLAEQQAYDAVLLHLQSLQTVSQTEFSAKADTLANAPSEISAVSIPAGSTLQSNDYLKNWSGKSLDEALKDLRLQAVDLFGSLANNTGSCGSEVLAELAADQKYLKSISVGTDSTHSLVHSLTTELSSAKSLASQVSSRETALKDMAKDANNFELVASAPSDFRIQSTVQVTVSWTSLLQNAAAKPNASAQPATNAPASPKAGTPDRSTSATGAQQTQPDTSPTDSADSGSESFTVNFGQGQRFYESGGVVFSNLAQHSYATEAANSSPGCTAPAGSTAAQGCIVDNGGAGWRILPIALVSGRMFDLNWKCYQCRLLVPNYLTFGATVKSNSSGGTNLEYLMGPSWASPGRQLFLTAGTYAGEVNKLGGGLVVGPQAAAPPTTLPISTPYRWRFGFALSYSFGSQGGDTTKNQTQ